jgi:hypothetical protein
MKPLASPAIEYRLMGGLSVGAGVLFGGVAVATHKPVATVMGFLFGAAIFGGFMYLLSYRRFVRKAVTEAPDVSNAVRESSSSTKRRSSLRTLGIVVVMSGLALAFGNPLIVGAVTAGNGAALLAVSRWISRWEQEHAAQVLREPRWRWSRQGKLGWGRGRGVMDPQDFYIVRSEPSTVS